MLRDLGQVGQCDRGHGDVPGDVADAQTARLQDVDRTLEADQYVHHIGCGPGTGARGQQGAQAMVELVLPGRDQGVTPFAVSAAR